ncbi:DNA repair protein RAD51 homolog 4 [Nephila pilipes]|uniref:DNA repair protein RAD51 homolog 4 n=1 Tax=Nephila pilipes TaxID=299642 RepID=A0A8X6TUV1_NEPPI|nr:DNA repair protein RAD51 homolog 4 [Nephila pilipes]
MAAATNRTENSHREKVQKVFIQRDYSEGTNALTVKIMPRLCKGICPLFSKTVLNNCNSVGIKTVTDFILCDPEDLARKIKASYKDVLCIHHNLMIRHSNVPQNSLSLRWELIETLSILDTGSKSLNKFLIGGIYTGEVTEIHGLPGSGKTQFCLSVISNLILDTRNTVLYLDTNSNFLAKRLEEMLLEKCEDEDIICKLQNVKLKCISDIYDLFDCLDTLKCLLQEQRSIFSHYLKLLVIDSITTLLAPCFGGKFLDGLGLMNNLAQYLNVLCSEHQISILICNNTVQGKNFSVKPALGLNWKYVPSVSLCIDRLNGTHRKIKAIKSCRSNPSEEANFRITNVGVTD